MLQKHLRQLAELASDVGDFIAPGLVVGVGMVILASPSIGKSIVINSQELMAVVMLLVLLGLSIAMIKRFLTRDIC